MRNDLKYIKQFNTNVNKIFLEIKELKMKMKSMNLHVKSLDNILDNINHYTRRMNHLVDMQVKIGLTPTDGLYGSLRSIIHQAEDTIKLENNKALEAAMLTLRRNEKDFMLRRSQKYISKFNSN